MYRYLEYGYNNHERGHDFVDVDFGKPPRDIPKGSPVAEHLLALLLQNPYHELHALSGYEVMTLGRVFDVCVLLQLMFVAAKTQGPISCARA